MLRKICPWGLRGNDSERMFFGRTLAGAMGQGNTRLWEDTVLRRTRALHGYCKIPSVLRPGQEHDGMIFRCRSATQAGAHTGRSVVQSAGRAIDRRPQFSRADMLPATPVPANAGNLLRLPIHNRGNQNRRILSSPSQLPCQGTRYSAGTLHFAAFGSFAVSASLE